MKIHAISYSLERGYPKQTNLAKGKSLAKVTRQKAAYSIEEQQIQRQVQKLKQIEAKVIAHEQAHKAAGGPIVGSAQYQYPTGPDGKRYIIAGEVTIEISKGKTPEETIRKMELVRRAAHAPVDPSPKDRAVAAQAVAIAMTARQDMTQDTDGESYSQTTADFTSIFTAIA